MHPSPPSRILETALYVDDLDRAGVFYGDVIGLVPVVRVPGRHTFFRCGDAMLLLFRAEKTVLPASVGSLPVPVHGATGQGHMCFAAEAEELDSWVDVFARAGITIEADFTWPGGARSIYVRDPAGNSVEFAEARLWQA